MKDDFNPTGLEAQNTEVRSSSIGFVALEIDL